VLYGKVNVSANHGTARALSGARQAFRDGFSGLKPPGFHDVIKK
jgi:hypothetical protein